MRPVSRLPRRLAAALAFLACAALAGCTVGPDLRSPEPATPSKWGPTPTDVPSPVREAPVDEAWWRTFHDAELTSLVDRLARQNLDLQSAAERIAQARAQRAIVRAQGLPHVDGRSTYLRERVSKNGMTSLLQPAPGAPLEFDLADDTLQASWELDLFGRVRRAVEAAGAGVQAVTEARRALTVSAEAELAQSYVQLRGVQAREEVLRRNLDAADRRRKLVRERRAQGVANDSDVAQADAQAAAIGENLPTLVSTEARLVNTLGLLLGEPPRTLRDELFPHAPQASEPPSVPVGLPSELLRRRPDIREAEARLHAATAQTGVAVADFFPDVTLNGAAGVESLGLNHLFDWASRMFMIGPTVTLPIFQGGRLRGQLELRRAQQREAAIGYRQIVLQALHDVDNALTSYGEAQHRRRDTLNTERNTAVALRVAEQRYGQGVANFIDVTVAQADLLRAQDATAQAQTDVLVGLVTLYRALGGGWRPVDGDTGRTGAAGVG